MLCFCILFLTLLLKHFCVFLFADPHFAGFSSWFIIAVGRSGFWGFVVLVQMFQMFLWMLTLSLTDSKRHWNHCSFKRLMIWFGLITSSEVLIKRPVTLRVTQERGPRHHGSLKMGLITAVVEGSSSDTSRCNQENDSLSINHRSSIQFQFQPQSGDQGSI